MKKLLLFIFLLVLIPCFSQGIEGIGSFKLEQTTISDLNKYLNKENYYVEELSSSQKIANLLNSPHNAAAILKYTKGGYVFRPICPQITNVAVNKINIANIILKNVLFVFYNDVLIEIRGEGNSQLDEALKLKYGNSNLEKKEETKQCLYNLTGITRDLKEETYTQTWGDFSNGVYIKSVLRKYYNEKCNEETSYTFTVSKKESILKQTDCRLEEETPKYDLDKL